MLHNYLRNFNTCQIVLYRPRKGTQPLGSVAGRFRTGLHLPQLLLYKDSAKTNRVAAHCNTVESHPTLHSLHSNIYLSIFLSIYLSFYLSISVVPSCLLPKQTVPSPYLLPLPTQYVACFLILSLGVGGAWWYQYSILCVCLCHVQRKKHVKHPP